MPTPTMIMLSGKLDACTVTIERHSQRQRDKEAGEAKKERRSRSRNEEATETKNQERRREQTSKETHIFNNTYTYSEKKTHREYK